MGTPKGNGLVEITGENKAMDKGWFCMDLMGFLRGADWDTFIPPFSKPSPVTVLSEKNASVTNAQ